MKYYQRNSQINELIEKTFSKLTNQKIIDRIWEKDFTVWNDKPDEISNRLGWLDCPVNYQSAVDEISLFVNEVRAAGYTHALLLGMGGSSLAPEVFRLTFGVREGYLDLSVLDSTHPGAVKEMSDKLDIKKTLFIVSTKSGGTIETLSFMKYFYNKVLHELGREEVGKHFAAITDPGSKLEKLAVELSFRKTFLNDPNIGGRYSALSFFGLVPAALCGISVEQILNRAEKEASECKKEIDFNTAARLGVIIGVLADDGIDKLTLITSPQIKYFGAWAEQLIAESTGKNGKGILPVDLEEVLSPGYYSNDRVFVYMKLKNDTVFDKQVAAFEQAGFPVIEIELNDVYDLGSEYFRWEFATAVAGWVLGIQPFDQPNVESAKVLAKKMIAKYKEEGKLPEPEPDFTENGVSVFAGLKADNLKDAIDEFLSSAVPGKSYVAIQAYIKPDEENFKMLQELRTKIQKKYKVATTVGFGPRFLHSTGQLHKGDAGNGLFIQIVDEPKTNLPIPDEPGSSTSSLTFGTLIKAQALGDRGALVDCGRRVITLQIEKDTLNEIVKAVE